MDDRVIQKIQKLLKLADSHNENEAKLAAERANELLLRHNLTMQQVGTTPEFREKISHEFWYHRVEDKFILPLLRSYFFVRPIYRPRFERRNNAGQAMYRQTLIFIGEGTNTEVAAFVYDFLVKEYRSLWLTFRKQSGKPESARQAYYEGLALGLSVQLRQRKRDVESEVGLIWLGDKKLDDFMKTMKTREKNLADHYHDKESYYQGVRDGKDLHIMRGLKEKEERKTDSLVYLNEVK